MQKMIPEARTHLNLASRRKRRDKKPPPPLMVGRRDKTGSIVRWDELPKDQHPYWLVTCGFAPPGILTGADPTKKPLVEMCMLPGQDWQARWGMQAPNVAVEYFVDSNVYSRVLAKIAHSFAVAILGTNGFEPFLCDTILKDSASAHRYVGGPERDQDDRKADPSTLHSISMVRQGEFVIVYLRLFSFIEGTPNYIIVAGRRTPSS